ncbi:Hypothetical predicted protein [Octopus vulgaris]|uniref:Uncharacterized protein n=1 Tax=Octopus vulgaris TaxID=6645 RepID=A0AA36B5C8_OCTVU|nr:Hypothetical predicted protein [Octopus vulgaris]
MSLDEHELLSQLPISINNSDVLLKFIKCYLNEESVVTPSHQFNCYYSLKDIYTRLSNDIPRKVFSNL